GVGPDHVFQLTHVGWVAVHVVEQNEALHAGAPGEQDALDAQAAGWGIPLGDRGGAAYDDARPDRQVRQDGVRNGAGRVVEVHINAVGTGVLQGQVDVFSFVVDGVVVAELCLAGPDFFGRPGQANAAAT